MSGQEPPPMSPALRALIDADNQRPGPSDGVRGGVYAALGVSLGVLPAGAIAAAQAATTTTAAATTAAATPAGSAAASTVVGAAKVVGPLAFLAKAPLIGVGVGAVLGATLTAYIVTSSRSARPRTERAPVAAQVAPAAAVTSAPPPPAIEPPAAEPEPTLAPARAKSTTKSALPAARRVATPAASSADRPAARAAEQPKAGMSGALSAEQSLLDPARAALARGDGASALSRLALHERRFPAGLLSQEREAMAVRALVLTGARADAERRAASFRARYPGSLLGPTIDSTLRGDATLRGSP